MKRQNNSQLIIEVSLLCAASTNLPNHTSHKDFPKVGNDFTNHGYLNTSKCNSEIKNSETQKTKKFTLLKNY